MVNAKLDFTPHAQPAPPSVRVWSHARTEAGLILRNGEQALLALVIPTGILVAGRYLGDRIGQGFTATAPSVLALAIWSTCFTTLAIATGFERRYDVLERLAATPLGRSGILMGKACGIALITAGQVAVLALVAVALGWRPTPSPLHVLVGILATVLAMAAFAGLALALAGTARPEITLAVANLVYLLGMVGGGIMLPLSTYPGWAQPVIAVLPTAALGEALRSAAWWAPLSLLAWAAAALLLARKVFRWTS